MRVDGRLEKGEGEGESRKALEKDVDDVWMWRGRECAALAIGGRGSLTRAEG